MDYLESRELFIDNFLRKVKNKPNFKILRIINARIIYSTEEFSWLMKVNKLRKAIQRPLEFQSINNETTDYQYELKKFSDDINFLYGNEHWFLENIKWM